MSLRSRLASVLAVVFLAFQAPTTTASNTLHWAFQPLQRPPVPPSAFTNPIDAFTTASLPQNLASSIPEADRRTLIRRLSFDLRGLPPSREEVREFVEDNSGEAFARIVRKFLASPQYGERWGRHWLDIVGYADSNGYFSADSDRPLAWKFRDYVIRSINADKPLDRFVQEQVAGDELVGYVAGGDATPEMVDALIATHFWRNVPDGSGESDGNPLEVKVDKYAVLEGGLQLLGSAFLGVTLQCARCHDHKFEPVTQANYYGLQAMLRPAFDPDRWLKPNERIIELGRSEERAAQRKRVAEIERELKTLDESLAGLTAPFRKQVINENLSALDAASRQAIQNALDTKEKERTGAMKALLKTHAALVEVDTNALQKRFPAFAAASAPVVQAIRDLERNKPGPLEKIAATFESTNAPPSHHLLVRGNHAQPGSVVAPHTPEAFRLGSDQPTDQVSAKSSLVSSGRRLGLARWLTAPDNPVVARVLVNRVWHCHFGEGLVATLDNLGQSGARPVNQQLLDWLACELIRSGWSLKHLHGLILNSATWKSAGRKPVVGETVSSNPVTTEHFPHNTTRRLDAEALRDAMLAVSGELDLSPARGYVPTKTDKQGQVIIDEKQPGAHRRSIYLQQRRTQPVDFLATFDGPAHNPVCVQRVSSTVALQSLSLLNSEFVQLRARALATRVLSHMRHRAHDDSKYNAGDAAEPAALDFAFEIVYSRPATIEERRAAELFLKEQAAIYRDQPDAPLRVWTDLGQMLLASNAFLYVD